MEFRLVYEKTYNRAGDLGRLALVGASVMMPLRQRRFDQCLEAAISLFFVAAVSKALKASVSERRPNSEDYKSFPSQHAAESFAAAAAMQRGCPRPVGVAALSAAGAVSVSRVLGKKHYPRDVIAGILISFLTTAVCSRASAAIRSARDAAPGRKRECSN